MRARDAIRRPLPSIDFISFCVSGIAISVNEIEAYVSGLCLPPSLPSLPLLPLRLRRRPPRLHYNDKWAARAIISLGQISCQISHFRRTRLLSFSLFGQEGESERVADGGRKTVVFGPIHPLPSARAPGQSSVGDQRDAGGAGEEGRKFESKARMFINGRRARGPRAREPNPDRHPGTEDSAPATTGAAGERTNERAS